MELAKKGKKGLPPKSVKMTLVFWMSADRAIHLATNDQDPATYTFHVAIRKDGTKPSGHPYLYRELVKCLKGAGAQLPE